MTDPECNKGDVRPHCKAGTAKSTKEIHERSELKRTGWPFDFLICRFLDAWIGERADYFEGWEFRNKTIENSNLSFTQLSNEFLKMGITAWSLEGDNHFEINDKMINYKSIIII